MISKMPVYDVYMQELQGEMALCYLIRQFEASLFYNDITYLN